MARRSSSTSKAEPPRIPPQDRDLRSKRAALQRILDQSQQVVVRSSDDPVFKTWKNLVERTLVRIYGQPSPEVEHFHELRFYYNPIMWTSGDDFTHEHRQRFERDFQILTSSIKSYIEELPEDSTEDLLPVPVPVPALDDSVPLRRVFVSHASADAPIVEEVIELLEIVGLTHEQIFCTSFPGYDIDLGDNFLDAIKAELLNANALVLFLLTPNFFQSPISLCEMGATWVLAKEHIPIIVPPLDFSDVKGVVPLTQGFRLNEPLKLNMLKEKIEAVFGLQSSQSQSTWERRRDRVLERINAKLAVAGG
jgi:hypothetical protein